MPDRDKTSYKATKRGVLPRSELLVLENAAVARGIQFIRARRIPVTPDYILALHKKAFGPIFDWAGKFRKVDVRYGGKDAPHFYEVPALIKQFCDDLEERCKHLPDKSDTDRFFKEIVSFLAWLQHRFVVIHPFDDYNGRTARLVTNALLLRLDLPPLEIAVAGEKERKVYIAAMRSADERDYSALEALLYAALQESLEANLKK
jgi:cell filamentation protein